MASNIPTSQPAAHENTNLAPESSPENSLESNGPAESLSDSDPFQNNPNLPYPAPGPLTPQKILALQRTLGNQAVSRLIKKQKAFSAPVNAQLSVSMVQRNVGFEIEVRNEADWRVWEGNSSKAKPVPKSTPIIHGNNFQVQAEYNGEDKSTLEFVTNAPGLINPQEYETSINSMVEIGNTLNSKKKSKKFPASEIPGGDSRYTLEPGNKDIIASLQVTVGVPLDSMEALFKNLGSMAEGSTSVTSDTYNRPVQKANKIMQENGSDFEGATDQLKGFIILIQEYLQQGQSKGKAIFPKELIPVMARTDFSAIFKSLPDEDRGIVQNNLEKWVKLMLDGMEAEEPLLKPVFDDAASSDPAAKITTSRQDWLTNMPEKDLLSEHGQGENLGKDVSVYKQKDELPSKKKPLGVTHGSYEYKNPEAVESTESMKDFLVNLYMGFGAQKDKTDTIKFETGTEEEGSKSSVAAPIIELRNPPSAGPVSNWKAATKKVFDAVDDAIKYPKGKSEGAIPREYSNVLSEKGAKLRASYEKAKVETALLNAIARAEVALQKAKDWKGKLKDFSYSYFGEKDN